MENPNELFGQPDTVFFYCQFELGTQNILALLLGTPLLPS